MSVVLVNGDGNPAVHASQDADLLGGIGGQETGILDINDKFAATIADANTVEISSGVCITKEGRRIQIDVGDVEEIVVPTGSQGTTKYYIIGFHLYTDGSGNQLAETFIDEVASPSATITEKMFKDGETEVYVSLYRITRNGLNLEGLTLILPKIGSLAGGGIIGNTDISGIGDGTVTGAIAQINTDLSVRYNSQTDMVQIKDANGVWHNWKVGGLLFNGTLYENGTFFVNMEEVCYGNSDVSYNASSLSFIAESSKTCALISSEPIDLTNYSYLKGFKLSSSPRTDIGVAVSICNVKTGDVLTTNAVARANSSGATNVVASLDVSSYSGEYYVAIGVYQGSGNTQTVIANKLWLE